MGFAVEDIENWVLNSTAETLDELMKEGPPHGKSMNDRECSQALLPPRTVVLGSAWASPQCMLAPSARMCGFGGKANQ